jgi:hypothetical protein
MLLLESLNQLITLATSLLLTPFKELAPAWGLSALSLIAGGILVLAYGRISNQKALRDVKRKIAAGIYEAVLFRHDVRLSLRAQGGMLISGFRYLAIATPPLVILIIPSLLLLAQLNLRYGSRAIKPGESVIVSLTLNDEDALFDTNLKSDSPHLRITPPLRDLSNKSISWRVDALQESSANLLALSLPDGREIIEQLAVGYASSSEISAIKHTSPWWQILYPGATIPKEFSTTLSQLEVTYPRSELSIAGIKTNWMVLFFVISLASGLLVSKVVGVEI